MFRDPNGRGFLLPIMSNKMRNNTQTTTALQEQTLPMNLIGLMTTPTYQVENPIHEIQSIYAVNEETAIDIYETVGEDYHRENLVAALCGIATPSSIAKLKGGLSC